MMFIAPVRKPAPLDIVFFTIASPAVFQVCVRSLYVNIQDGADWAGDQVNKIGDAFSSGLDSINPFS